MGSRSSQISLPANCFLAGDGEFGGVADFTRELQVLTGNVTLDLLQKSESTQDESAKLPVNINVATTDELCRLPNITQEEANIILSARTKNRRLQ